jgi:hypothetical protein
MLRAFEVWTSDKLDVEPYHSIVLDFLPLNLSTAFLIIGEVIVLSAVCQKVIIYKLQI